MTDPNEAAEQLTSCGEDSSSSSSSSSSAPRMPDPNEVPEHPPAVAVLALPADGEVNLLLAQLDAKGYLKKPLVQELPYTVQ